LPIDVGVSQPGGSPHQFGPGYRSGELSIVDSLLEIAA